MKRATLLASLFLCAGCKAPTLKVADACAPYAGQTCISLEIAAPASSSITVDQIEIAGLAGIVFGSTNDVFSPPTAGIQTKLPVVVPILVGDAFASPMTLVVRGLVSGSVVGTANPALTAERGQHVAATVTLAPGTGPAADDGASTVVVDRATGVAANGADAAQITIRLVDHGGAPMGGRAIGIAATPDGATVSWRGLTDADGRMTGSITATTKGVFAITATVEPNNEAFTLSQTPTVAFTTPGKLSFSMEPAASLVDGTFAARVSVVDPATGDLIGNATTPVSLSLSPVSPATLSGDIVAIPNNGVATFDNLSVDAAGTTFALIASAPSLASATSKSFTVTARAWSRNSIGLDGATAADVTFDPRDPGLVYAATNCGIYKSIDGGTRWRPAVFGLDPLQGSNTVAIDPTSSSTIYASGATSGVYRSTNSGASWMPLPFQSGKTGRSIYIAPSSNTLLVDTTYEILRSVDSGLTWTTSLTPAIRLVKGPGGVYSTTTSNTVSRTTDDGGTWTNLGVLGGFGFLAPDPANASVLYAATTNGAAKTIDGGLTWQPLANGLPSGYAYRVAVARSNPNSVYVAFNDGSIYASGTAGQSWSATAFDPALKGDNLSIAPDDPKRVFVSSLLRGLFKTNDGGSNWTRASTGIPPNVARMTALANTAAWAVTTAGIFRSTSSGSAWAALPALPAVALPTDVAAAGDSTVWVASSDGLYRFDSAGARWLKIDTATTNAPSEALTAVSTNISDSNRVIAGSGTGVVYRSSDGGTSWAKQSLCTGDVTAVRVVSSTAAYATCRATATTGSGVFATTDGGSTWMNISGGVGGIAASIKPLSLTISTDGSARYVGGDDGVVYKTTDDATWMAIGSGLPAGSPIVSLVAAPTLTAHIFAATGSDVYALDATGSSWTKRSDGLRNGAGSLAALTASTIVVGTRCGSYLSAAGGQ